MSGERKRLMIGATELVGTVRTGETIETSRTIDGISTAIAEKTSTVNVESSIMNVVSSTVNVVSSTVTVVSSTVNEGTSKNGTTETDHLEATLTLAIALRNLLARTPTRNLTRASTPKTVRTGSVALRHIKAEANSHKSNTRSLQTLST